MTTSNIILSEHWENFIKDKVDSGEYSSANEVIQDSLRLLEEREKKIEALRKELIIGEESVPSVEFDFDKIPKKAQEQANKIEAIRRELIKGEESGSVGYVDKEEIKRLGRLRAGINEQRLM